MRPVGAAPPAADPCLSEPYSARPNQQGGTIVAEGITSLSQQRAALLDPDLCRPARCLRPGCDCPRLHTHEVRERHPRELVVDGEAVPVIGIVIFECAECSATWRVLPAFLARCLWRTWAVIEREASGATCGSSPAVPARTVRRWRARLAQAAVMPIQVLAVAGDRLRAVAQHVGLRATRQELLIAHGEGIAAMAVLLHRLAPGVRLM